MIVTSEMAWSVWRMERYGGFGLSCFMLRDLSLPFVYSNIHNKIAQQNVAITIYGSISQILDTTGPWKDPNGCVDWTDKRYLRPLQVGQIDMQSFLAESLHQRAQLRAVRSRIRRPTLWNGELPLPLAMWFRITVSPLSPSLDSVIQSFSHIATPSGRCS